MEYVHSVGDNVCYIIVKIGAHIYAEEELRDDYFDFPKTARSISPKDMMRPLRRIRDKHIVVTVYDGITVEDFENNLNTSIWGPDWQSKVDGFDLFYTVGNCRAEITDGTLNLNYLLDKYLDPLKTGIISVAYYVCEDAGDVYVDSNLRFHMHSNEQGHNLPHVHVIDRNTYKECSICILDGELLQGEFKKKDLRKAQRIIEEKRQFFIDCWNAQTDGIKIDINHQLRFIKY